MKEVKYNEVVKFKKVVMLHETADLRGFNLIWANLRDFDLRKSDISWLDMRFSDLRGANLEKVNLAGVNLDGVKYDEHTKFPEGFNLKKDNGRGCS